MMSACDMIRPPMNSQGGPIATRDRLQFAHELFDRHAEAVYHYVLAWTGEQASAVDLTAMVLRTAVARMDQLADGADPAELEMRVIALTRAAVTRWRGRRPGKRPVGVPATAPARGVAAKAPARGVAAKAPATGRPTGAPASTPAAPRTAPAG